MNTPIKIVLQVTPEAAQLRVFMREGFSTVIDGTRLVTGKSIPVLRKQGKAYAKRFSIPFIDYLHDSEGA